MKTAHVLIAVVSLAAAHAAFAGGGPYPEPFLPQAESVKSRAQVIAEAREALRLGLLSFGEGDAPVATPEQERLIAAAGKRAVDSTQVAKAGRE